MVQNDIDLDKTTLEILSDIANDNRKRKCDTELDRKYKKFTETITALDVLEPEEDLIGQYYDGIEMKDKELEEDLRRIEKPVSWADRCETSDDESGPDDKEDDDEDDFWNTDQKDNEDKSENIEYRMDNPRGLSKWKWDDEVFMANSSKTKYVAENDDDGFENWLMDSGATTHVVKTTKKMFNLKTAIDGEHVRVGSNETLKATAIGDVCLEQKHTNKRMILREVMVIPNFARNLINVGRLNENGNEFVFRKDESELRNPNGETMKFEKESDGMTYLKASRVTPTNKVYNSEDTSKRGEETIKKSCHEAMDINEAHRKFGHATEKVVRSLLKSQGIKPTGDWAVCDGCARAKAT